MYHFKKNYICTLVGSIYTNPWIQSLFNIFWFSKSESNQFINPKKLDWSESCPPLIESRLQGPKLGNDNFNIAILCIRLHHYCIIESNNQPDISIKIQKVSPITLSKLARQNLEKNHHFARTTNHPLNLLTLFMLQVLIMACKMCKLMYKKK